MPSVSVPAGFRDEELAKVPLPTSIAFTPDRRMLVSTQAGRLHLLGSGKRTTLLDLSQRACSRKERGLLGLAVDPAFGMNEHIFLFYTARSATGCVNRVSRFNLDPANRIDPGSETVLIDNISSKNGNHNGGDLQFGPDGHLYVGVGDGGCDYDGPGCHEKNDASRDPHALIGKVLRITKTGGIPDDNPFTGPGTETCALRGRTERGKFCRETFLMGLRNPFRMAFDPDPDGPPRLFVNDPGQNRWEEINEAFGGADYGWNSREGRCVNQSPKDCSGPPPGMTDPIFDYPHTKAEGCRAITGGAFAPRSSWPEPFGGAYLFADFGCGEIFRLEPRAGGGYRSVQFAGNFGRWSLVHMVFGPDGPRTSLYLTSYANGGEVHRLSYIEAP